MALLHDLDLVHLQGKFEHRNGVLLVVHELSGDGAAGEGREFLSGVGKILFRLDHSQFIAATLRLHWNDKLLSILINAHVDLVDFDLAHSLDRCSKMVLNPLLSKLGFWRISARGIWQNGQMRRETVESTTMKSVGYETQGKILEIEFQSGAVYQYLDVPERVHEGLRRAESKGQYFNGEIRDEYAFICIGERGRATGG